MASTRASEVAEILWELKRADKLAKYSVIAQQAGFSAGTNGRTMKTTMKAVRRDWPHLQWWRAIVDNGEISKEQEVALREAGLEFETSNEDGKLKMSLETLEDKLMNWQPEEQQVASKN